MRITAVSAWFPTAAAPSRGSFVLRDLLAIARHHEVRLVHLVPPQDADGTVREVVEGLEVLRVPMSPRRPAEVLSAARALGPALAGADVVHTMAFPSLLPFSVPGLSPVPQDAAWVHTEHWSALSTPASLPAPVRPALPLLARVLRGPDRVTSVCEFLAEPIRAVRGTRPVDIVPCIVDPHAVVPRRDRSDGGLRLVSTGGLIPRKDPLVAVATIAELVGRGVDAHLTWLGDGPLREATAEEARRLGVSERVDLVGTVDAAGVVAHLSAADLFFGPTRADNFFVSAAEAIVAGRPVVLGATGGQGEYVRDEVGALVDVQDADAYADAVLAVDARTRDLPADEIAATIGDSFSTPTVGRGYDAVYRRAVSAAH
ncbi:glycosyltransferase [Brachybacterium sp. J144]|uniref:glycosyltransferase n=1 Tax=Brachybacterium sp. J144 TaxID=3116487 RepID=UPI002E764DFD|nr:glycosyltransferase [Brachybacterium sp. J144]MEE1649573.1 glycosyltransferase [Brachybacterium sp. J144]